MTVFRIDEGGRYLCHQFRELLLVEMEPGEAEDSAVAGDIELRIRSASATTERKLSLNNSAVPSAPQRR